METLRDDVKLLKGEIKRTLTDLRVALMQHDAPLHESSPLDQTMVRTSGRLTARQVGNPESANYTAQSFDEDPGGPLDGAFPHSPAEGIAGGSGSELFSLDAAWPNGHCNGAHSPLETVPSSTTSTSPVDINLTANLVKWVSRVRERLGPEFLHASLALCSDYGSGLASVEKKVASIAALLDQVGAVEKQASLPVDSAEEWSVLLLQLHGILQGHGDFGGGPPRRGQTLVG